MLEIERGEDACLFMSEQGKKKDHFTRKIKKRLTLHSRLCKTLLFSPHPQSNKNLFLKVTGAVLDESTASRHQPLDDLAAAVRGGGGAQQSLLGAAVDVDRQELWLLVTTVGRGSSRRAGSPLARRGSLSFSVSLVHRLISFRASTKPPAALAVPRRQPWRCKNICFNVS